MNSCNLLHVILNHALVGVELTRVRRGQMTHN